MAVTKSTAAERRRVAPTAVVRRPFELAGLLLSSIVIAAGLVLVWQAKTGQSETGLVNVNALERREQLLPVLAFEPNPRERQKTAAAIWNSLQDGKIPNVGALARGGILTPGQVARIKPLLIVRTEGEFRNAAILWFAVYFAGFYALHLFWRMRGFTGEQAFLPAIHLLTGAGLILMIALRDPLRDTLAFADFAQSVALGVAVMAGASQLDYQRLFSRLSYIPLLAAIALSIALIAFGTGPGQSDAKVNLLGFQPVEAIKILITFFLAGYFASRWEFLRVLKERRPELANISRHVEIPRLEYLMPVLAGVALTLVFFFLQKDLGPALVISCVFLALYAVARGRALLSFTGLVLLLGGFLTGYALKFPRTVYNRVEMWLSPWDNAVRGGEQVVHALWAMATGGLFGTGPGLGDPVLMPAAHTDLILAVLGEEWGFVGVLGALVIYILIVWTGLRIAMRSNNDYSFFLALGLTLLIACSTLLIAGGVLDLLPLSGVVTPFLSYGGTAMLANFLIVGILCSVSRGTSTSEKSDEDYPRPFRVPVQMLAQVLAIAAFALVAKAAWIQVVRADATAGAGALTLQADGFRRFQYNPRLMAIARDIPRGTVFDRNGLPLATSDLKLIEEHRDGFVKIGVTPAVDPEDSRHYPLGALTVHLLGDLRTRANWGASNSSLIERDSVVRLQGYNDRARVVGVAHPATGKLAYTIRYDFRELMPLLRHRQEPNHPDVRKVMDRNRDVQTSLDARLQVRAARILQAGLKKLNRTKGSAVVLDVSNGDLLASVSYPWPDRMPAQLGPGRRHR